MPQIRERRDKLGVDVASQVSLGACHPPLAYEAIQVDPSIAAVLPYNVVVRTLVEAFDPEAMMGLGATMRWTRSPATARAGWGAAFASLSSEI